MPTLANRRLYDWVSHVSTYGGNRLPWQVRAEIKRGGRLYRLLTCRVAATVLADYGDLVPAPAYRELAAVLEAATTYHDVEFWGSRFPKSRAAAAALPVFKSGRGTPWPRKACRARNAVLAVLALNPCVALRDAVWWRRDATAVVKVVTAIDGPEAGGWDPAWRTSAAVALADGMTKTGDFSAAPILADALQEAGCGDEWLLARVRDGSWAFPGSWVTDNLLGRRSGLYPGGPTDGDADDEQDPLPAP